MQNLSKNVLSIKNVALSIIGLAIASKITVPLYPVPITMQMFAVYYLGLVLAPKEAFSAILGWLCLGSIGWPVFASSVGGISGPSAGYLIGMLFGCPLVGILQKKFFPILSCIGCYVVVHIFGCLWLSNYMDWNEVIKFGVIPFLIPEIFKITTAIAVKTKLS